MVGEREGEGRERSSGQAVNECSFVLVRPRHFLRLDRVDRAGSAPFRPQALAPSTPVHGRRLTASRRSQHTFAPTPHVVVASPSTQRSHAMASDGFRSINVDIWEEDVLQESDLVEAYHLDGAEAQQEAEGISQQVRGHLNKCVYMLP